MDKLRIVFMGTPEFAVGILDVIIKNNYTVVGVVTASDKPAGRGQQIKYSAIKEYALHQNLHLLQPTSLKDEEFLKDLKSLNANLQVVVAFRMLPKVVWNMPQFGTFNLHASILPNYRGAAPINWAIINGDTKTGVTTFFIDEKIDTGAIILNEEIEIFPTETAGELHDRLMQLGAKTVVDTLKLISGGDIKTTIQKENENLKTAYKLDKENCKIDWSKSGETIHNLIRGLSPYPSAWTFVQDNDKEWSVKFIEAIFNFEDHNEKIGKIITTKKEFKVMVQGGVLTILCLQFPGKKKMTAAELLNGMQFSKNATVC